MSSSVEFSHRGRYRALLIFLALLSAAPLLAQTSPGRSGDSGHGPTTMKLYPLISFDADNAKLTPLQHRILKEYVFEGIISEHDPTVEVIGYTDVMGLSEHNKRLSLRRAESVANAIRQGVGREHYRSLIVRGVGEDAPYYANDLPEGRFYNRMVQVRVITSNG